EGRTLSIQCPYTAQADQQLKVWCRVREGQCEPLVGTVYQTRYPERNWATKGKVTIEDDLTNRTVSITMTNLQAEDSDTYACAFHSYSGYVPLKTISLTVFKESAGTTLSGTAGKSQPNPSGNTPALRSNLNTFILLSVILSALFILALISSIALYVRQRKQRRGSRQAEDIYDKPEDIAQLDSTERMESPQDDSKDLNYVTLNFKSRLSFEDPLYCNVEPSQTRRKPEDENVEYAIIAFKQLPTNDK
ncbi:TRML1 protein, partial [Nyctiprogne leucopyga]|nr:TRML1 protein [Nyctiprogne leucopyga]